MAQVYSESNKMLFPTLKDSVVKKMYICTTCAHTPKHFNPSPSRCWTFHRNLVAKTIAGVVLILWWIRNNLRKMSIYTDTHNTESAIHQFSSVQFSRLVVSNSCDPMDRSMPGLPVHHQLPEFTQTHVHWVGDAIQPSHPLSSPSPPAPNPSQHQGLFQWVSSLHQVVKLLEFQFQHQSVQWTPRTDL